MIEIKFPANNKPLAAAIGAALSAYANDEVLGQLSVTSNAPISIEKTTTHTVADASVTETEKVLLSSGSDEVKTVESVETVTEQASSTETHSSEGAGASNLSSNKAPDGNATDNLDEKKVGFNPAFCSKAAIPFNQSGKKKGQWKRRQGVPEESYDAWYEASLAAVGSPPAGSDSVTDINTAGAFTPEDKPLDTSGAFQGQQNGLQTEVTNTTSTAQGGKTFADAGEFMQWLSEQQAGKLLTTGDIDSAYASTQTGMGDLFNPATAQDAIGKLYNFLAPIAAGQQ